MEIDQFQFGLVQSLRTLLCYLFRFDGLMDKRLCEQLICHASRLLAYNREFLG
jgi:hypothetical protein